MLNDSASISSIGSTSSRFSCSSTHSEKHKSRVRLKVALVNQDLACIRKFKQRARDKAVRLNGKAKEKTVKLKRKPEVFFIAKEAAGLELLKFEVSVGKSLLETERQRAYELARLQAEA